MDDKIIPVFVIGAPRSGTTFLASSIASHPNVVALPEMHYIYRMMEEELIFGVLSIDRKVDILKNDFHFCSMGLFDSLSDLREFLVDKDSKDFVLGVIKKYNEKYHGKNYVYWVEHSPHSHRYMDVIISFFPKAMFLHSIRDPRAVIASTFREPWGFKDVISGANSWNGNVVDILKKEKLYNVKTIKYEDIVENAEKYLKDISDFLCIEYSDDMLRNNGVLVQGYFEKKKKFVGKKADSSRTNKWRMSLSRKQIEHINARSFLLMLKYGYINDSDTRREIVGLEKKMLLIYGKLRSNYAGKKFKKEVRKEFCNMS